MYQVTFSEQSMRELEKLSTREQMQVVEPFSNLSESQLKRPREPLGRFHRGGVVYFRLRTGDYRIYFEEKDGILYSHYILHKNTLTDFVFRTKLPISEEQLIEQHQSFWKYLETLGK